MRRHAVHTGPTCYHCPRGDRIPLGLRGHSTTSTGIGFTPGFASRLDLADGRRVFVKAASDADDARYGWGLSEAYREEFRKLRALPSDLPAPALLWTVDDDIAGVWWVILCFEYVDGVPPRRPWQPDELAWSSTRWPSSHR